MSTPPNRPSFEEFHSKQLSSNSLVMSHKARRNGTFIHVPTSTVVYSAEQQKTRKRLDAVVSTPVLTNSFRRQLFVDSDSEDSVMRDSSPLAEHAEKPKKKRQSGGSAKNANDSGVFSSAGSNPFSSGNSANYRYRQIFVSDTESSSDESTGSCQPVDEIVVTPKSRTGRKQTKKAGGRQANKRKPVAAKCESPAAKKRCVVSKSRTRQPAGKDKAVEKMEIDAIDSVNTVVSSLKLDEASSKKGRKSSTGTAIQKKGKGVQKKTEEVVVKNEKRRSTKEGKKETEVALKTPDDKPYPPEEFGLHVVDEPPMDGRPIVNGNGEEEEKEREKQREQEKAAKYEEMRRRVKGYCLEAIGYRMGEGDLNESSTSGDCSDISIIVEDECLFSALSI